MRFTQNEEILFGIELIGSLLLCTGRRLCRGGWLWSSIGYATGQGGGGKVLQNARGTTARAIGVV